MLATAADAPRPPRPRSAAQREASQLNGARSRGPVTEEGKAASSMNALTHGLYAVEASVLPGEDGEDFARRRDAMITALDAVGEAQVGFAHTLCAAQWRERRIEGMLNRLLAEPPDDPLLLDRRMALYTRLLNQAQLAQARASSELRRLKAHATTDREERQKSYHKGVLESASLAQYEIARLKRDLAAAEAKLAAAGLVQPELRNEPGSANKPPATTPYATDTGQGPPPALFTPEEAARAEAMLEEAASRRPLAWLEEAAEERGEAGQPVAARVTAKLRAVPEEGLAPRVANDVALHRRRG